MGTFGTTQVPSKYQAQVIAAAARYGVPPAFLAAQIDAESGFNPNAVSPDGAIGIAQFMPATAKSVGLNPHDANASIMAMAKLMAYYKKEYGSWEKALYAYHGGPGVVNDPGPASLAYAKKVLGNAGDLTADVVGGITDAVNPFKNVEKLLGQLRDREAWIRVGYWGAGFFLVVLGIVFLLYGPTSNAVKKVT
jgi:soluble lytic murein transglycosylase-like protein